MTKELENDLEQLQKKIGFKTAFMATMGFYVAQTVATFLGLGVIGFIMWAVVHYLL